MGFGGSKPVAVPVSPPAPIMPGLNSLFQTLFGSGTGSMGANVSGAPGMVPRGPSGMTPNFRGGGGSAPSGAGPVSIDTLTQAAAGQGIGASTVTPEMIAAIRAASANTQKTGFAQIQNKFAASGMSMSTDLMKSLADYNVNFGSQTEATIADLQFKGAESAAGRRLAASNILEETFSNAAMAFAPTQVVGTQGGNNAGGAAIGGASSIISAMILAAAL